MSDIETVARNNLFRLLRRKLANASEIDLNKRLAQEYGLTSLDKILFMTAVCAEAAVPLMTYTEVEIARLATLQNVIESLQARRD